MGSSRVGLGGGLTIGLTGLKAFAAIPSDQAPLLDLRLLDTHGLIEHDVSLSRADAASGDNHRFNQTWFDESKALLPPGATHWTMEQTANSHHRLLKNAQSILGSSLEYGATEAFTRYTEFGFIHAIMTGSNKVGDVPLSHILSFIEHERLPIAEGWRPATIPVEMTTVLATGASVFAKSPDPLNEAVVIATSTMQHPNSLNPLYIPGSNPLLALQAMFASLTTASKNDATDPATASELSRLIQEGAKSTQTVPVPQYAKAGLAKVMAGVYEAAKLPDPNAKTSTPNFFQSMLSMLSAVALAAASPPRWERSTRRADRHGREFIPDAPYSVPTKTMEAAITCPHGFNGKDIVLLVHGTGGTGEATWRDGPYGLFLPTAGKGYNPCWIDLPERPLLDVQLSASYVAYAIQFLAIKSPTGQIAVIGYSQGSGINVPWALTFWPSMVPLVSQFIGLASDFHGTATGMVTLCNTLDPDSCVPSVWQQTTGSNYLAAQIGPDASSLLIGAGNHALQDMDICGPSHVADHLSIIVDPAAYGLALAALENGGPVNVTTFDTEYCTYFSTPPPHLL
ncbi:hypothetical protein RQP46_003685 [Phenoliferia psychrophenolica]